MAVVASGREKTGPGAKARPGLFVCLRYLSGRSGAGADRGRAVGRGDLLVLDADHEEARVALEGHRLALREGELVRDDATEILVLERVETGDDVGRGHRRRRGHR